MSGRPRQDRELEGLARPTINPGGAILLPETAVIRCEINSDGQALTAFDRTHKYVINFGGKGSGKTWTHTLWAQERGQWDTGQIHGIFTNTEKQLKEGVFLELFENLPRYGIECDYGHKPPVAWSRRWAHENIPIPRLTDYRGIFYTSDGLHALCGTLFNQSYTQYETLQFASLRIEEVPALTKKALTAILSRLRCGKGKHCDVEFGHRHQAHLFGNPPVGGAHPWLFDFLDTWEEGALKLYHALGEGETCEGCFYTPRRGDPIPKEHGPQLNHRQWPLLRAGIGNAIYVKSATVDNEENLNAGYEDDLAINYDKATADAWLGGEMTREVSAGCYTESFSDANIREVGYDPNRTLYACIDINTEPRVSVLAQPLLEGEYPADWHIPGVEQIGIFGEFFHVGGMSDRHFAEAMMAGKRGSGDAGYPNEELRGLPKNWLGLALHNGPIIFYGDAEGNRRSVHDDNLGSSWIIMKQTFRKLAKWSVDVPDNNPAARARIHSVCAKLTHAPPRQHQHSLSIAPRARHTIKDCELVVWDEKGSAEREWRNGPEIFRTHCMAAVGYMAWARSPYGKEHSKNPSDYIPRFGGERLKAPRIIGV